jgi:phosphonate transport system ATP-binding protein
MNGLAHVTGASLLAARGLSKTHGGRRVLDDVTLDLAPGAFVALVGPSGSGKTTLIRCLAGLAAPDAGTITLDGTPILPHPGRPAAGAARGIGIVDQSYTLVRRASARHNVLAGRLAQLPAWRVALGWYPAGETARAEALLATVGLAGMGERRADRLSGGERQRVAIARALAQDARVILADEPVASLDPDSAASVLALLAELARRDGRAVLASLHQPALARAFADRVLRLEHGRIVAA